MAAVTIIDGGGANIASLQFALQRLGADSELTADVAAIRTAGRLILPGVGAAADGMRKLRELGLESTIRELTQPLLGICLGMQLLFDSSAEDDARCLGIIPGRAEKFIPSLDRPVPHMGWNRTVRLGESPLLEGLDDDAWFYFVHSYAIEPGPATIATADYGKPFSAIVQQDNFMGTQFHPERSGTGRRADTG